MQPFGQASKQATGLTGLSARVKPGASRRDRSACATVAQSLSEGGCEEHDAGERWVGSTLVERVAVVSTAKASSSSAQVNLCGVA